MARAATKHGMETRSDEKRETRRESLSATHLLESSGDEDEEQDDVITARAFPALSGARGGFFDENDPENTEKRRIRDASFPSLETETRRDSEDEKALFFRGRRTETERSRRVAFSGGPPVLSRAFVDSRDRPSARAAAMRAAIARGHFGDKKCGEKVAKRRWVDDGKEKEKEKGKPAFRSVFVGAPAGRDADAAASANDAMAPRASVDARSGGVPTRDPGARARHAVRTAAAAAGM